jgi:hypothetical protein
MALERDDPGTNLLTVEHETRISACRLDDDQTLALSEIRDAEFRMIKRVRARTADVA